MGVLAYDFFFGEGVAKDSILAWRWSAAGAALGDPSSINMLVTIFEIGMPGFPSDAKQASNISITIWLTY